MISLSIESFIALLLFTSACSAPKYFVLATAKAAGWRVGSSILLALSQLRSNSVAQSTSELISSFSTLFPLPCVFFYKTCAILERFKTTSTSSQHKCIPLMFAKTLCSTESTALLATFNLCAIFNWVCSFLKAWYFNFKHCPVCTITASMSLQAFTLVKQFVL